MHECYLQLREVSKAVGGEHVILECRECMYDNFYSRQGFKKLNENVDKNGLYTLYNRIKFKDLLESWLWLKSKRVVIKIVYDFDHYSLFGF